MSDRYTIHNRRFLDCIRTSARVDRLYDGCRWAEGPAWFPAHRSLIWSDIPNNRMLRWDEPSGQVSVFRAPSNYSNGNTVDRQGRLVTCEHGRRVTRTEHDGRTTVLAERIEGKRLNSPNDVVVKSDESVWFTDPTYGIDTNYEGDKAQPEINGCHVYRIDSRTCEISCVLKDFVRPNGLAFSHDEKRLYVVDSGGTHFVDGPRHIRMFDVSEDGSLASGAVFADHSHFDGLRVDEDGRVWTSATNAVRCYEPDGTLIGEILLDEPVSNLCFGGPKLNRLFITATTSLYSVMLAVSGAKTF